MGLPESNHDEDPRRPFQGGKWDMALHAADHCSPVHLELAGLYSFVDGRDAEGRMWGWDQNPAPRDDIGKALFQEELSLRE